MSDICSNCDVNMVKSGSIVRVSIEDYSDDDNRWSKIYVVHFCSISCVKDYRWVEDESC